MLTWRNASSSPPLPHPPPAVSATKPAASKGLEVKGTEQNSPEQKSGEQKRGSASGTQGFASTLVEGELGVVQGGDVVGGVKQETCAAVSKGGGGGGSVDITRTPTAVNRLGEGGSGGEGGDNVGSEGEGGSGLQMSSDSQANPQGRVGDPGL